MVFVPVADEMIELFDISRYEVNLSPLIFYFAFPFAIFLANYLNDNVDLKLGMTIGNLCLILGTGLCLLIESSFYYALVGSFINGIGSTFVINPLSRVGALWFN